METWLLIAMLQLSDGSAGPTLPIDVSKKNVSQSIGCIILIQYHPTLLTEMLTIGLKGHTKKHANYRIYKRIFRHYASRSCYDVRRV